MYIITILLIIITVYLVKISRKLEDIDFYADAKIEGFEERMKKIIFEAAEYINGKVDDSLPTYTITNKKVLKSLNSKKK